MSLIAVLSQSVSQSISRLRGILSKKTRRRTLSRRVLLGVVLLLIPIGFFSYLTNPFVRFSIIVDPFTQIQYQDGQFHLQPESAVFVKKDPFFQRLALIKSGWHIVGNRFSVGGKSKAASVDEIVREIHKARFNPELPFLISGDHFSVLYPRSLGVFYNSLMDPRTALDEDDWRRRQQIYLKTTAYALQVFDQSDRLSTTIVPVGPRSVALINFYAPPSDTLYSILYALTVMRDSTFLMTNYAYGDPSQPLFALDTQAQAEQLLATHQQALQRHFRAYVDLTYDHETGLVKKDLLLSGTKDIARRQSAFYDNVVLWRTMQMAQDLGIAPVDQEFLAELKQRIIGTFWLEDEGYFLEDLSEQGIAQKYYSSDWLIALMTGFLDVANDQDLAYYVRSVEYIQRNAIDQPFGLQYHPDQRRDQLYGISGTVAPEYGSTAIWSHWGMEYIKLLSLLAQRTGDSIYLEQADAQLSAYSFNIKRYRGYPEVYDKDGDFFRQTFYKSVRQTGWVVNFLQAREMYRWTRGSGKNSAQ